MKRLISFLLTMLFVPWAHSNEIEPIVYSIVSSDSNETMTSKGSFKYRFRAIVKKGLRSEVPGTLFVEKWFVKREGIWQYRKDWSVQIDLSRVPGANSYYKNLSTDEISFCCDYSDLKWDKFRLKFKVSLGTQNLACLTNDVSRAKPKATCKTVK